MNILEYENQIISDAQQYKAKISRDIWGVPHISGKRDADVAFGLAFAHAEDDIKNIAENMYLYRAQMGLKDGSSGAVIDYLIKACLLYTSPSPRDISGSRMPSSA